MKGKFLYAAAAVLALVSTVGIAKKMNETEYTYVNAKGQVVGGKTFDCDGSVNSWGSTTPKFYVDSYPCN